VDSSDGHRRFDRFVGRVEDLLWSPCVSCQRKVRGTTCEAFPKKIPEELLNGTLHLNRDYPGDACPVYQAPPDSKWFALQQSEGPRWEPRRPQSGPPEFDQSTGQFCPSVVCADVGSIEKGRFGWWHSHSPDAHGGLPSELVDWVSDALDGGLPVALGFECPLFVPLRDDERKLLRQRQGESGYPFAAAAGACALVTGAVESAWVLRGIRRRVRRSVDAFLDWEKFVKAGSGLFLWEAFVAGAAKTGDDIGDARAGAEAMASALPDPRASNAVECTSAAYSLIGAALLRTGWSTNLGLLSEPCLVIRA